MNTCQNYNEVSCPDDPDDVDTSQFEYMVINAIDAMIAAARRGDKVAIAELLRLSFGGEFGDATFLQDAAANFAGEANMREMFADWVCESITDALFEYYEGVSV